MATSAQPSAEHAAPESARKTLSARDKLVITLLLISTFVVFLNETIMSVALPHLMRDLDITASAAQWLTTAFMLTMAVVIPITGFLIQRMNTRPIFMLAMSLFSIGTLVCAIAPSLAPLIIGRIVQACGTAIMMPLMMTTVMTLVPRQMRGTIMGNISIVISVAPAIGPTISGLILNYLSWRWMFIFVLPIALLSLVVGMRMMKNVTTPRYAPLDIASVILSAIAFGGLVYGLSTMGEGAGGENPLPFPTWVPVVVGLVALVVFVLLQLYLQGKDKALLDLRVFRSPIFAVCIAMMAISMMALFGSIILLPIYTQNVLGLDALTTGLLLLPGGLLMGLLAPWIGRRYDQVGPRTLVVPGAILLCVVLWSLTFLNETTPVYLVLIAHLVLSLGLAHLFTPLFTASLSAVPSKLYSHGSAILGTIQQVAGGAGTALFIAVMTRQTALLTEQGAQLNTALAGGIHSAFVWAGVISIFAVVAAFFIKKPEETDDEPQADAMPAH